MKNKKRSKVLLLILLLLGISIGFALLSTTLKINGTAGIKKNTWSVYWDNVGDILKTETTTVNQAAVIDSNDNTLVNFNVLLTVPGDYYEFQVDAVNAGTLDAMLDVVSVIINDDEEEELPSYLKYTVTYADGSKMKKNHLLAKADQSTTPSTPTRERLKVRIEYDANISPEDLDDIPAGGENYDIKMEIPYKQATDEAVDPHAPVPFADADWETIASLGNDAATQTEVVNGKCGSYNIGDTKTVEMDIDGDNTPETYSVRIANCSTPVECSENNFSQTACGFVIEFADIIDRHRMNPNSAGNNGGWPSSEMRLYLNGDNGDFATNNIYNKLPVDLKNNIADTDVVSSYGRNGSANFSSTDKLYLASTHEIWKYVDVGNQYYNIEHYDTAYANTRQLDYYRINNVGTDNYGGAVKGTAGIHMWTRSASVDYSDSFISVDSNGAPFVSNMARNDSGVSPAFKLK